MSEKNYDLKEYYFHNNYWNIDSTLILNRSKIIFDSVLFIIIISTFEQKI